MYKDVIREAKSEQEIYFLLTSYVEAVRFGDQLNVVPAPVKRLPLAGRSEVRQQYQKLVELDQTSKAATDNANLVIKEALPIVGAALERLESLPEKRS